MSSAKARLGGLLSDGHFGREETAAIETDRADQPGMFLSSSTLVGYFRMKNSNLSMASIGL